MSIAHLKNLSNKTAILCTFITVLLGSSLLSTLPVSAAGGGFPVGQFSVKVVATISGAAAEPGNYPTTDTITPTYPAANGQNPSFTIPEDPNSPPQITANGITVTYMSTAPVDFKGNNVTIKACSANLNGACATIKGQACAPRTTTCPENLITITGATQNPGGAQVGSATNTTTPAITCNAGINPLNWAFCAMVSSLVDVANDLDNLVNNLLSVGTGNNSQCNGTPVEIFGGTSANCNGSVATAAAYKAAWSSFRDIALGLLVLACLIVIIASAMGFEVLDAYTIRKVLPRILVVAIAITLSWQLMELLVQLTNDLGYGIRYLMYKPFESLHLTLELGGGKDVAVTLIGGAAITALGIFGLLLFAFSAALSLFMAFVVMILRQILITMLIIIAPIAIVCYVLPNTQRVYTLWWNTFLRALLMFVIIEAIITAGRIFAAVAAQDANPINQLIAFGAYFGVYLIVPKTWQFGGAAVAAAGNVVNRAAQGSQAGLRKKRGEVMSANIKKARSGQRWNENFGSWTNPATGKQHKGIGHYANRFAVNMFDQDELARYRAGAAGVPGFKRYHAKIQDELDDAAMSQSIEAYKHVEQEGGMHYQAWRALTGTGMADLGDPETVQRLKQEGAHHGYYNKDTGQFTKPTSLTQMESIAEVMQESSNEKVRLGGIDLQNNAGYLATIKSHQGMEYANIQAMATLGLSADGRADPTQLAAVANSIVADRHGGEGVAQRVLKQAQKVGSGKRPEIRQGHGVVVDRDAKGNPVFTSSFQKDRNNNFSKTAYDNVLSIKSGEWSGAKAESIDYMQPVIEDIANYGSKPGERNETRLGQAKQMRAMIDYQAGPYGPMEADARRRWADLAGTLRTNGFKQS